MPKRLTDATVRNAKPKSKPYKMSDGEGLFLLVTPTGSKYWRLRYFLNGKEKLLALGVYPHVSLIEAREKRMQTQKQLAAGTDPGEAKKEEKKQEVLQRSNPFEKIADEWFRQHESEWATTYSVRLRRQIDRHLLPKLGKRPIAEINTSDVLTVLRGIEAKGTLETAHRMKQVVGQIFMYGIATQRADRNPVPDLQGALKTPQVKHHPSLAEAELPVFFSKLARYDGSLQTKLALRLLILTFVRTSELRGAKWPEINWEKAEWRIPPERMKIWNAIKSGRPTTTPCTCQNEERSCNGGLISSIKWRRKTKHSQDALVIHFGSLVAARLWELNCPTLRPSLVAENLQEIQLQRVLLWW